MRQNKLYKMSTRTHFFRKKYIGDGDFYKYALSIALPMILQNVITNFVSMLDNIMVGQIGTAQMSGVSIVNQFMFIFNLTIFGGISGAGIFGTQFFGKQDAEGQKYTVRFRLILVTIVIGIGMILFTLFGSNFIGLYLKDESTAAMSADTLRYGLDYLRIMIWGLIPFAIGQAYASAVRECGETKIPMYGSMAAIGINLILDYGLIFGKLGMPEMGVAGAAVATVAAKIIEAGVVIGWAHLHPEKNPYIRGLYRGMFIPWNLTRRILIKGCPLLFNEFLWSLGMATVTQCYSLRGLEVVAAGNIANTIVNLFSVVYVQIGSATGIIVGARLGAGEFERAKDMANKLLFFAVAVNLILLAGVLPMAWIFPAIYKTEPAVRSLATFYICIQAIAMPLWAYTNSCYFILRCGGRTMITILFDCVFTWGVMIPFAFVLTRFTNLPIRPIFVIVTFTEIVKITMGYFLVRSNIWVQNIVS